MSSPESADAIHWQDALRESAEAISAGMQRPDFRASAFRWLQPARITKLELDDNGKWTGFVTVAFLAMAGTRANVKLTIPMSGQGQWLGGPPEEGAMVIVGWLPAGIPVIVGYAPVSVEGLEVLKALPKLKRGELYARAGLTNEQGVPIPGGWVRWDEFGRVVASNDAGTAELTVGSPLTAEGDVEKDPTSGRTILMQLVARSAAGEALGSLSFDDEGNIIIRGRRLLAVMDKVDAGEAPNDLDRLVTVRWVQETYLLHVHSDPASGITGTPQGGAGSAFSKVMRSE